MKIFIISLAACVCFSCTKLALIYEGVKKPALETPDRLTKFLIRQQIDTSEMLCFQDTLALYRFYGQHIGIPEARFFNRQKQLVDYRDKPSDCNGHVAVFMEKMDSINYLSPDPVLILDNFTSSLAYAKDMRPFQLESKEYDLYLVMYWAKFMGKVNKHKVFEWETLAAKAKQQGLKIRVLKINVDFHQLWGITEDQMPDFEFR